MAAGGSKEMEIAIKIAGKVESSFKAALGQATKGIGEVTKVAAGAAKGTAKGMGAIAKVVGGATAAAASAVSAMGVAAINVGREFEGAMSQVAATMLIDKNTAEGQKAFETLENAARECGASTAFSATEAAEALNYLALAGYDADKAATALPTVLKLAGAGAMDLAAASDMVTDSMSALGIKATEKNLTQFSDQLAQTASKANTSVAQLGKGILTVGGTAKGLAGGTTELNTALGILADNGLKGAEGGTHLRNMILSLQNPRNAKAASMFKKLGIQAYDAKGNMRALNDIFGDLDKSMKGMSKKQKDSILTTIFKQTDLAAANAMLTNCGDRFDELSEAIENSSGACEDMYAIQLDNLNGDIDILKSGLSDLGISVYKDLNGPLREMTQLATSMVGELSEAYKSGGMEGMVGAVGGCMAEVVNTIAGYAPKMISMGVSLLENFIGGITENSGTIADTAAEIVPIFANGVFTLVPQVILAGADMILQFVQGITGQLPELIDSGMEAAANLLDGITERLPEIASTALEFVQTLKSSLLNNAPKLITAAGKLLSTLLNGLNTELPKLINSGTQMLTSIVAGIVRSLPSVISTALTLVQTLVNSIGQNAPMLINAAIQLIGNLVLGIISMLPQLIQMGIQLILNLAQGIMSNLPLLLQMAVQIVTNLVTGLVQMLPMLIQGGIQLIISLIQGIIQNLPNIIQAAVQIVITLAAGLIQAIPQLIMAIPQLIGAIIDTILSTNWIDVGIQIIKGLIDGILSTGKSLWSAIKSLFTGEEVDIPDTSSQGAATVNSYASGINSNAGTVTAAANSMATNAFSSMDTSSATVAGTQTGAAFSTGLTDSMTVAGTNGAAALTAGLNTGLSEAAINTNALAADTSGITTAMTAAGTSGAKAIGIGMNENSQEVTQAAITLGDEVNTALDGGWDKANTNAQAAMQSIIATVTNAAKSAANAVKSAFENMTITIPKPKIPVISATTSSVPYGDGGSVSLPQFSVNWNAVGGIFDQPTIFNTAGSGLQGVGEAGPEAVLPLDTLWAEFKSILSEVMQNYSGQSVIEALVAKLQNIKVGGGGGIGSPELAGAGGTNITYAPTYQLYGSATKEDAVEAEKLSQAEFNKMMKQWQHDNGRKKF